MKAGIPHVIAPDELLAEMLTLRISLDPMTAENGPLTVLPRSHVSEARPDSDLGLVQESQIQVIQCEAGDVLAMRPLLAHSSLKSAEATRLRRRVLHFELSPLRELPGALEWHCYTPLRGA